MKYFFQLGLNQTLSVAEIMAVFRDVKKKIKILSSNILILETDLALDVVDVIEKMGGVIKIGVIKDETSNLHPKNIVKLAVKMIQVGEGKFKFGISYYGSDKMNLKTIGMETKKHLREKQISCRWVTSKEKTLSSVVVEQNKLTSKGLEIVLIKDKNKVYIAKTLVVQAFKKLSRRDYGRPARDDESGMLPPKLAQIMINLARKPVSESVLLDPFCGSGTVLNEAMLMGYQEIKGSDMSQKAIDDTRTNFEWLYKNTSIKKPDYKLFHVSATEISEKIKDESIDLIVTEPYLGPQRGRVNFKEVTKELEDLYSKALLEFYKVLKKTGRVVMIFPVFLNKIFLNPEIGNLKRVKVLEGDILKENTINLSKRDSVVYGRQGQKVWREIVVLEKQ